MVAAGFLDKIGSGSAESRPAAAGAENTLLIHDWVDYKRPKPRRTSSSRGGMGKASPDNPSPNKEQTSHASRDDRMVEHGSQGAIRVDCVGDAAREGEVSGSEWSQPTLRAVPYIAQADAAISIEEHSSQHQSNSHETVQTYPSALPSEPSRTAIAGQNSNLVVPPRRDAEEEIELRTELPANTDPSALPSEPSRPAVAGHDPQLVVPPRRDWWPLYLDTFKKAGSPLDKDARSKILEQFNKHPQSAIHQIKQGITRAMQTSLDDLGVFPGRPP